MLFASFNWPLPIWLSTLIVPGARRTVKARKQLFNLLLKYVSAMTVILRSQVGLKLNPR